MSFQLTYDPVQFILTSIKNSELDTMYFFLNTDGTVDTIRDYNGNDTKFLYYPNGNLKSVTLPAQPGDVGARTTTYNYDARSDYQDFLVSVVDALSNTYSYVPDADLRVIESKDALTPRNSTFFRYVNPSDPTTRGLLDQITAPSNQGSGGNARKTNYFFDDFLRIVQVNQDIGVSAQATRLSHVYDGFSNLISQSRQQMVNGPSNTTTWSYDRLGRNITSFDPLGRLSRTDYAYYCMKNLVSTARGLQILTQMDSLCRITQISSQREQRSFSYDEIGRVVRDSNSARYAWNIDALTQVGSNYNEAVYENGRLYEYDSLDRVITITFPDGTTQRYQYDKVGNVKKVTDTQGQVTDYLYHPDNRLKSVTVGTNSFSYEYDLAGRLKKISYPVSTGVVLSFTDPDGANGWDANSRLVWMRYLKGTNNLRSFNYSYDNSGNRTGLVDTVGTGPVITWSYSYDWLNRLLSATRNGVSTSYSYDNCDNRLTTVGTTTKFDSYDFGDQLLQRVDGATTTFTYDRDGNMQSRTTGANTYTYLWSDFGNLQKSLLNGASQASHFYDSGGIRRISGDGSKYYSSGSLVLTENRPAGPVSYIQGHQLLGIKQGGNLYYMISDGLGSMLSMVDSTGTVVASNETDAYGVTLGSPTGSVELRANTFTGALGVRLESNSQTTYGSSDLYYARARYYDSSLGRWLSPDPIGFAGGLNYYGYVNANPINAVDPSGLFPSFISIDPSLAPKYGKLSQLLDRIGATPNGKKLFKSLKQSGFKIKFRAEKLPCGNGEITAGGTGFSPRAAGLSQSDILLKVVPGKYEIEIDLDLNNIAKLKGNNIFAQIVVHELGHAEELASNPLGALSRTPTAYSEDPHEQYADAWAVGILNQLGIKPTKLPTFESH